MSPIIDTAAITISSPAERPLSFLGIEVIVLGLGIAGLVHAVRAHRRGQPAALLTWITIAVYGVVMELVSYSAFDNFAHGQFTVMFYGRQLPLYIIAVYPVLLYTGITTARQLGLPRYVEPIAAGLLIVAMDAPFDVVGPAAGWWRWYDNDPNLAYRWLGVPVTSYYWHFTFGAVVAALTGWVSARAAARQRMPALWLALPLSVAIIVAGMVFFVPFHLLEAAGVSHGVIVACALTLGAVVVTATPRREVSRDRWLPVPWLLFYSFHATVAASLAQHAGWVGWGARFGFVATIAAIALAIRHAGVLRRPALGARAA